MERCSGCCKFVEQSLVGKKLEKNGDHFSAKEEESRVCFFLLSFFFCRRSHAAAADGRKMAKSQLLIVLVYFLFIYISPRHTDAFRWGKIVRLIL